MPQRNVEDDGDATYESIHPQETSETKRKKKKTKNRNPNFGCVSCSRLFSVTLSSQITVCRSFTFKLRWQMNRKMQFGSHRKTMIICKRMCVCVCVLTLPGHLPLVRRCVVVHDIAEFILENNEFGNNGHLGLCQYFPGVCFPICRSAITLISHLNVRILIAIENHKHRTHINGAHGTSLWWRPVQSNCTSWISNANGFMCFWLLNSAFGRSFLL